MNDVKVTTFDVGILSWNLTSSCNLKCLHCYVDTSLPRNTTCAFDVAMVKRIAREAKSIGINLVFLAGGEPLLIPELPAFVEAFRNENLEVHLCTNLTLLTEARAKELQEAGLTRLSAGIEQTEQTQFEAFRRRSSFRKVLENLALCKDIHLPVNIDFTLTRLSVGALDQIHAFAIEHGCVQVSLKRYVPEGRGQRNSDKLMLDPIQYRNSLLQWALQSYMHRDQITSFVHDPFYPVVLRELGAGNDADVAKYCCKAGGVTLGWLGISPDGTIHPCPLMRTIRIGNVFETSLEDALTNTANRRVASCLPAKCSGCDAVELCRGGCKATRIRTNGLEEPDLMCWKLRQAAP